MTSQGTLACVAKRGTLYLNWDNRVGDFEVATDELIDETFASVSLALRRTYEGASSDLRREWVGPQSVFESTIAIIIDRQTSPFNVTGASVHFSEDRITCEVLTGGFRNRLSEFEADAFGIASGTGVEVTRVWQESSDLLGHNYVTDWEIKDPHLTFAEFLAVVHEVAIAGLMDAQTPKSPESCLLLLQEGFEAKILGSAETIWLEAKSSPYELKQSQSNTSQWKIELAQDVAAFANSRGGLIIIGAKTEKQTGRDVITGFSHVPIDRRREQIYFDVLRERISPMIQGLNVQRWERGESGDLYTIHIPRQRTEQSPFVVQGGIIDRRVVGTMISIPSRSHVGNHFMTAGDIHSLLAAGRAFLEGKNFPINS